MLVVFKFGAEEKYVIKKQIKRQFNHVTFFVVNSKSYIGNYLIKILVPADKQKFLWIQLQRLYSIWRLAIQGKYEDIVLEWRSF